jgi:DNA-binding XRE family transcriptional regulator
MTRQQNMRMSVGKSARLREQAKETREKWNLSQEKAARLLGIAKNTWVRWETEKFTSDETLLELLPYLARDKCPSPCSSSLAKGFDVASLARHLQDCRVCWLAINYLAVIARKAPPPRNF